MMRYLFGLLCIIAPLFSETFISSAKSDLSHKMEYLKFDGISRVAINKATKATKLIYYESIKTNHHLSKSVPVEMLFVDGRSVKK